MRISLIILSIVDVLCCGWILLQFPITKVKTDWAVTTIERSFLRTDLTDEEKRSFDFFKRWIVWNEESATDMLNNVRYAGIAIGAVLFGQNLVLLSILKKRKQEAELAVHGNTH